MSTRQLKHFITGVIFMAMLAGTLYGFDYKTDSLAVRAILDSNLLYDIRVEDVSEITDGRISGITMFSFTFYCLLGEKRMLSIIPPEIGNLSNLTYLSLGGNQLTGLPPEIGNLSNLTSLNLGSNKLAVLPPEICNISGLTKLDLGGNQLTNLPPEICNIISTFIHFLSLAGNNLCADSMPASVKAWADKWDPDWETTQECLAVSAENPQAPAVVPKHLGFSVFPSAASRVEFTIYNPIPGLLNLNVYDILGRAMWQTQMNYKNTGLYQIYWHPNQAIQSGIYMAKIKQAEKSVSRKFFVVK